MITGTTPNGAAALRPDDAALTAVAENAVGATLIACAKAIEGQVDALRRAARQIQAAGILEKASRADEKKAQDVPKNAAVQALAALRETLTVIDCNAIQAGLLLQAVAGQEPPSGGTVMS